MNETFSSVLLFYAALKNFFTTSLGWTIERVLSPYDVILTNGAGVFLRVQKKTNGDIVSIGLELGADPNVLEISTKDPELCFPFDAAAGGEFQGAIHGGAEISRIEIVVMASGERWSKRYRANILFDAVHLSVIHQDHLHHAQEPNFKERGGTYIQAGA
jgi:hypothetical protein